MNLSILKKQSGQSLIETIILLPLIGSCFILSFLSFQVHAQHLWIDQQLYQALICLAQGKVKFKCQNKMKKNIESFLQSGKLKNIQLTKRGNNWKGFFIWKTAFWNIQFKKTINLQKNFLL